MSRIPRLPETELHEHSPWESMARISNHDDCGSSALHWLNGGEAGLTALDCQVWDALP